MKWIIKYCLDETIQRVATFNVTLNRRTNVKAWGPVNKCGAIYLLYYIIPSKQHKSQSYRYMHIAISYGS